MEAAIGHNSQVERNNDWIAVYRNLRTHPIIGFLNPDGTRRKSAKVCQSMAWIDLCMEANWKDRQENNNGQMVLVERGQLQGGRKWLADRWGWTEDQVRWFLKRLQDDGMVMISRPKIEKKSRSNHTVTTTATTPKQTAKSTRFVNIISVCNYNIYQAASEIGELLDAQANTQTNPQITPKQHPHSNKVTRKQVSKKEEPIKGSPPPHAVPRVHEEEGDRPSGRTSKDAIEVNCETITGPGFVLDLRACELEVQMAALPIENTKLIAEVVARDWVATKSKIRYPAAAFRQALIARRNQFAVDTVRLEDGLKRARWHAEGRPTGIPDDVWEMIQRDRKAQVNA